MNAASLFARMGEIAREIERLDKEFPSGPDEETHPRIKELIREGEEVQKQLDPLVRDNAWPAGKTCRMGRDYADVRRR